MNDVFILQSTKDIYINQKTLNIIHVFEEVNISVSIEHIIEPMIDELPWKLLKPQNT